MARRSEHSLDQIKEMILQAAESIIDEQGLDGLTVRKIALEVGYTVGSVYMVFASMNDLIMQLKVRLLAQLGDRLSGYADQDAEALLRMQARAYFEFADAHFQRWQSLLVAVDRHPLPAWYAEKIQQVLLPLESTLGRLLSDLDQQQLRLTSKTYLASLHGLCLLWLNGGLGEAKNNAPAALDLLVDSFIRARRLAESPANARPPEK